VIDRASPRITWKPSLIATSTPTNLEPALGPPIGRAGFSCNELSGVEEISLSDDNLPPMVLRLAIPDAELSTSNRSTVLMESSGSSHRMD